MAKTKIEKIAGIEEEIRQLENSSRHASGILAGHFHACILGEQQGDCPVSCILYPDIIHTILFFLVKNDASSLPLSLVHVVERLIISANIGKGLQKQTSWSVLLC